MPKKEPPSPKTVDRKETAHVVIIDGNDVVIWATDEVDLQKKIAAIRGQ